MKTVVTGAAGFVGSHLTQALLEGGNTVLGVDRPGARMPEGIADNPGFELATGDVRDTGFTGSIVEGDCDVVFHLAAVVGVTNYLSSPFDVVDINVIGTRNLLAAAQASNTRFLLASTSEIYGKNPKVPWSEEDDRVLGGTQVDRWSYSTSKAAAEHLTLAAGAQLRIPVSIVRFFNAYGPRQAPNYVISKSIHRALNGEPPLLYDSGEQTRCFTYIDDVVDGTIRAGTSDNAVGEVFNLGSNVETTIREAIATVITAAGVGSSETEQFLTDREYGGTYQDIVRRVPDVSKAHDLLDWEAKTSLTDGVAMTIAWARDHPEWLSESSTLASDPTTTSTPTRS